MNDERKPLKTTKDIDINYVLDHPNNRKIHRTTSVILPITGERVHRSISLSNSNFTSLDNADIDRDTDYEEIRNNNNEVTLSIFSESVPILDKFRLVIYYLIDFTNKLYTDGKFKNLLKCSIAYFIASLAVYWQPFNKILGNSDFKHVVSTVVVYFHPSRTIGSMHITLIYVIISISFSFIISFGCRYLSSILYIKGQEEISYAIDLIISSISLGVVAFTKQRINKETFNTACSLASISIVACIIKEGSLNGADIPIDRLVATLRIVLIGCLISVTICYLIYPQKAVNNLRNDLNDSFISMSSLLSLITKRFLTGEKLDNRDNEIFNKLRNKIRNLDKFLHESKYELFIIGKEAEWSKLNELVLVTKSLSDHLFALRSSTEMQWNLLHEDYLSSSSTSSIKSYASLTVSQSVENLVDVGRGNVEHDKAHGTGNDLDYVAINSTQIFDLFVYYLAPSMKAFIFTMKNILNDIPIVDVAEPSFNKIRKFEKSLSVAINLFDDKQLRSFDKLYNQEIFLSHKDVLFKSDLEEVTACCGNFSSLLQLFGKELLIFLNVLNNYNDEITNEENTGRSWDFLKFWGREKSKNTSNINQSNINDALLFISNQYSLKNDNRRVKIWKLFKIFKRTDIQFGIRVGLGAFVLSFFAFYRPTKDYFTVWRLEWSLTIYCIMMNKSLGGTQMTVKWRFLGTFLGSFCAYLIWLSFDGHPIALGLVGFLLSLPCFYIIIYWKKNNAFGRFILLTYNLTALYSYIIEQHDLEDNNEGGDNDTPIIGEIAFHRFISVSIGVIWAIIMASVFIPNSARSRLKNGLTIIWLRLGIIWNSDPLDYKFDESIGRNRLISLKGKNGLNNFLSELELLLKQAPLEFRLKGKFPTHLYEKLIACTTNIIDAYHNITLMIEVDPILSDNELFVIKYIEQERHELEHRILLIFYMISSSLKLMFPIPSKPASTEHAKDRLLYKLNEVRTTSLNHLLSSSNMNDSKNSNKTPVHPNKDESNFGRIVLSNEDYVLLYSYILVTSTITQELDKIIEVLKQLLGDVNEEMFQLV